MEKNIKDYLHLYLGCECILHDSFSRFDGCHKLTGVSYDDTKKDWWAYFENSEIGHSPCNYVIPLLRPLSDITEEEMREVVLINYAVQNTLQSVAYNDYGIDFKTSGFAGDKYIDFNRTNAETITYLFSKDFDLLGLIESGLAIDKTKQLPK